MYIVLILIALYGAYLAFDAHRTRAARPKIAHIVHVNGIRGKSSVSRLIHAGLTAGGVRSFCKVTGTDPMVLLPDGTEKKLFRPGRANIREQAKIMRMAAVEGADVLVIECMAITPEMQHAAQHKLLRADIGVLTNVRRDHTDVMGETLEDICISLMNASPENGVLFTAEENFFPMIRAEAEKAGTRAVQALPGDADYGFDFAENIALALSVCEHLGVDRATALSGMKNYSRDPYALSVHRVGENVFINGLSINDPASTVVVYSRMKERYGLNGRLVMIINNRADRGCRTQDMLRVCDELKPDEVILFGASQPYMRAELKKICPDTQIRGMKKASELDFSQSPAGQVFFAVGNLKGAGRDLLEMAGKGEAGYV
ncbi:MAG: poly-gamma-glutamate synthase PgsB [Clostridia bacterium]|nr:poly-gamma-glutamate synthase PgsB [Clostridia bacterium]